MIKFKKNKDIRYIKIDDKLIPIDKIVYIEKCSRRVYDSVRDDFYYDIYYDVLNIYKEVNYYNNKYDYNLRYKHVSIDEGTYKYLERTIFKDKIINIKNKFD